MIEFHCNKCKAAFRVADDTVGQMQRCQWCGEEQAVPDPHNGPASTVRFRCGTCGVLLEMPGEFAGRKVRCSECDAVVDVPMLHPPARHVPDPPEAPLAEPVIDPAEETPLPPPPPGTIVEFRCQFCGHEFRVSAELAGKKGKCKSCGAVNVVPAASDA